jgi:hypothetical protein
MSGMLHFCITCFIMMPYYWLIKKSIAAGKSLEFSNATNSFKSLCRFAKRPPIVIYQIKQDLNPLGRAQARVVRIVGTIRLVETRKNLSGDFHGSQSSMARIAAPVPPPIPRGQRS